MAEKKILKLILVLLLPVFGFAQPHPIAGTGLSGGITYNPITIVCTGNHIDTVKNVLWYVEMKKEWDSLMPMSTGCPNGGCTFLHTHNDETGEDRWFEIYHRKSDEWAYYIHEVNLIALKPKGRPIIVPIHH